MLKAVFFSTFAIAGAMTGAASAQDAAAGEELFRSCKACHSINNGDEVIVRGGRSGPNLFGVIGRQAGSYDGFRFGNDLVAAGEAGLVWTEESLAEFVANPTGYLRTYLDDGGARSKMSYKLRSGGLDMAAYLASLSPMMEMEMGMDGESDSAPSN